MRVTDRMPDWLRLAAAETREQVRQEAESYHLVQMRDDSRRAARGIVLGVLLGLLVFVALGACLWALFG